MSHPDPNPTDTPGSAGLARPADEPCDLAERRAGAAHAAALKEQARQGGLRFDAYLPSALAVWLLDLIARGRFADPSEAVFVMLGEQQELEQYPDLHRELFRRSLEAAANDPRPGIPMETVLTDLDAMLAAPRPAPAVWKHNAAKPA